ncbi:hypothetical protein BS50DRAFT_570267 [Corynespora cassiicola Philippines]|uniref:Uncharacterized protein n=1 Tax=Corynespora cassiicola Philippines TaxID=1448308 RepID=A0A2T2NZB3_CORCC|nr:hypothetical protein BS50DRAFT_570267 [Corynespora cassiicola Philippines]
MAKNMLWPRILGGVPRDYVQVTGVAGIEEMKLLASQVANGKLKVHVDTIAEMEDAQKVCFLSFVDY